MNALSKLGWKSRKDAGYSLLFPPTHFPFFSPYVEHSQFPLTHSLVSQLSTETRSFKSGQEIIH